MSTEDWEEAARCFYNQDWKRLIEIIERYKAMLEKKFEGIVNLVRVRNSLSGCKYERGC